MGGVGKYIRARLDWRESSLKPKKVRRRKIEKNEVEYDVYT